MAIVALSIRSPKWPKGVVEGKSGREEAKQVGGGVGTEQADLVIASRFDMNDKPV